MPNKFICDVFHEGYFHPDREGFKRCRTCFKRWRTPLAMNLRDLIDDAHRTVKPEDLKPARDMPALPRDIDAYAKMCHEHGVQIMMPLTETTYYVSLEHYRELDIFMIKQRDRAEEMERRLASGSQLVAWLSSAFVVLLAAFLLASYLYVTK